MDHHRGAARGPLEGHRGGRLPRSRPRRASGRPRRPPAPLDVIVVRKLGVPYRPEVAFGALGEGGALVIDEDTVRAAGLGSRECTEVERRERAELDRRLARYRTGRDRVPLAGRTVVIVDDGIATGATAAAACEVARAQGAARVVLAVPVAAPQAVERLRHVADAVLCLSAPADFAAVGQWYDDFDQTSDEEVAALLAQADARRTGTGRAGTAGAEAQGIEAAGVPGATVEVASDGVVLPGLLTVPAGAPGVVVFAHGSGSSRTSPRNRQVADALDAAGLGTLLFDLLTEAEAKAETAAREHTFDIPLLARRLSGATAWLRTRTAVPLGFFGASTGAAAALSAAAEPGSPAAAVVSRGGRPDLAGDRLGDVRAPTLLVVGGADPLVLDLNRRAASLLRCPHELAVVPGAGHLFEEPGALEAVAELARDWFVRYLGPGQDGS
ncbi:phosphoribosyltransferase [Streptomyces sp. WAC06614]|nr:phosphoribosyltransferase [Streptomyces sp. WAC06614]